MTSHQIEPEIVETCEGEIVARAAMEFLNRFWDNGYEMLNFNPSNRNDIDHLLDVIYRAQAGDSAWKQEETAIYQDALERIMPYPQSPELELGYRECRRIARQALEQGHRLRTSQEGECKNSNVTGAASDKEEPVAYISPEMLSARLIATPEEGPVIAFLGEVVAELERARRLFPGDRIMGLALAEEFGELIKALLDEPGKAVWKEAVQTAVMAARVAIDGDGSVDQWRAAKGLDDHRRATEWEDA
ncbi:hypothetical protein A6D6_04241 [Alcanivorax xiamenensis]|uniref:Uncharacterized protein n=1 Tax=Alcanivorax xiamenensis TaxID=1177156 RepID=A0ABQ6Y231_9GAMM|nr:hypothetical protein [Alcanivorax xiamenensis]KAF0801803.1 hypothetical protein A6D6_04241 [Alcanivorax xiamenensis]